MKKRRDLGECTALLLLLLLTNTVTFVMAQQQQPNFINEETASTTTTTTTTTTNNNTSPYQPETSTSESFTNCTPCDGEIDSTRSFDGLSCSEWFYYASQVPADTEECVLERLLGYQFCGCPSPPDNNNKNNDNNDDDDVCTFCEAGNSAIEMDLPLPFSSITCEAFVDVPKMDGDATCQVASNVAYYCGCPAVEPQCTLCPDGLPPQNLNAPLYLGMTCADIQDLYLVSSAQRCEYLDHEYPFDLQAYCGCNSFDIPPVKAQCDFCPYGGTLYNTTQTLVSDPTSTCGEWEVLAEFAKDGEASCAVFQYVGLECCDDMDLPDFFSSYFDNDDDATDVPTAADTDTDAADNTDNTDGLLGSNYTSNNYEQEALEETQVPFAPENLTEALELCFIDYTEPVDNMNRPPQSAEGSSEPFNMTGSGNNGQDASLQEAQARMGDLFDDANQRPSTEMASSAATYSEVTGTTTTTTTTTTTSEVQSTADTWEELYQELESLYIPQDVMDLLPRTQYANHNLLPGLSQCILDATDTFTDCQLCPGGSRPGAADKLIPIVGLYCDEYANWRSDASIQDCKALNSWLPFDMTAWCQCPGVKDPPVPLTAIDYQHPEDANAKCNFCPEGMVLVLESWKRTVNDLNLLEGYEVTSTCAEWNQMAAYTTREDQGCNFLQRIGRAGCCEFMSQSILDRPVEPLPTTTVYQPPPSISPPGILGLRPSISTLTPVAKSTSGASAFGVTVAIGLALLSMFV